MMRIFLIGLLAAAWIPVLADDGAGLGLTLADLERLGVVLEPPVAVAETEVASGLAEIVIPPAREAIVGSTVGGVMSRMLVAEGDFVAAGQPLAEIASAELLKLQREYVESALAAELAGSRLERDRDLHAKGIIAERRVQESNAAELAAATALDQARQALALAGMTGGELARLLESRELASTLLLRAPFAAFVIEQRVALGARIDALDPVYRIADLSALWLELHVPQERSEHVRPGMRVVASASDRLIEGSVLQIGRVADAASQTVLIRAAVDNEDLKLRVGQFLTARVLGTDGEQVAALAVPSAAIVRADGGTYVFGRRDEQVSAYPVEIVSEDGAHSLLRGDLGFDTEVAVSGVAALKSVWASMGAEDE